MKVIILFNNHFIYKKKLLFIAYLLFLFVLVSFQLSAQEIVFHEFKSEHRNKHLEDLLYLTVGVELSQAGLSSSRDKSHWDYILMTEYTSTEMIAHIKYILSEFADPPRLLAEKEYDLSIDYNLDKSISNVIKELLELAQIKSKKSSIAEIKGLESPLFADKYMILKEPVLTSSFSGNGIIFLGKITDYIHYGASGLANVDFIWPHKSLAFGSGLQISYVRAFNDPEINGGTLNFFTAGPRLQISTIRKKPFRFFSSISGGAAFITVNGDEGTLTKTVPYGDAGLHINIPFKKNLFWGGHIGFLSIFDDDILILGISTGLSLGMEF